MWTKSRDDYVWQDDNKRERRGRDLGLLEGLLTLISFVKQVHEIAIGFQSGIQLMRQSNSIALVRVMARNSIFPTIIERVDDGTNPEQQRLRIDMARTFPQERKDRALYYRDSQSVAHLVEQALIAVFAQVLSNAQPNDERTINLTIDYLDGAATYIYAIHGYVGGEWSYLGRPSRHLHIRQRSSPRMSVKRSDW